MVGHPKRLADEAFAGFADDVEFVNLSAFSAVPATNTGEELLVEVDRAMAQHPFSAVVATSESTMLTAGLLRSRYGLPGPGYDDSLIVTNKWRMRTTLARSVRSPAAWLSGEFLALPHEVAADVVIKPLSSSSARGVRRMDAAAARAWLTRDGRLWLVEQAVDVEREFHCDGAFTAGRVEWVELSEYDRPVLVSHGTRSTSILRNDDVIRAELTERVDAVVAGLGVPDGVFHMEFLFDGADLYFGEIGLRPAGTGIAELLRLTTGADLWSAFVAAQLGRGSSGRGPSRVPEEISGLVMARPSPRGVAPMSAEEARRLSGVVAISDGNIDRGAAPTHMCEFEYLAFFAGLATDEVSHLRERVAHGDKR